MTPATDWRAEMAREVRAMLEYVRAYQRLLDAQFGWDPEEAEAPALPATPPASDCPWPTRCPELPALARWQRDVLTGRRDPLLLDRLWVAACREQHARDLWGFSPKLAMRYVHEARATMASDGKARAA